MISEAVGFLLFSTIEGIGLFVIMLGMFRIDPRKHIWQALFMILLMNLQSYVLRNELALANLVPAINILLFVFFLTVILQIPVLWSGIISIAGYMAFAIAQTIIVFLVFGSIENAQSSLFNTYSAQTMTALIEVTAAWLMQKNRMGFTFEFERLRLRRESTIVITLMSIFLVVFSIILYRNDIWLNVVFFATALSFLLYYAIREEKIYD